MDKGLSIGSWALTSAYTIKENVFSFCLHNHQLPLYSQKGTWPHDLHVVGKCWLAQSCSGCIQVVIAP